MSGAAKHVYTKARTLSELAFIADFIRFVDPAAYAAANRLVRIDGDLANYPEFILALRPGFTHYERRFSPAQGQQFVFATTQASSTKAAEALLSPLAARKCRYQAITPACAQRRVAEVYFYEGGVALMNPHRIFFTHTLDIADESCRSNGAMDDAIARFAASCDELALFGDVADALAVRGIDEVFDIAELAARAFGETQITVSVTCGLDAYGYRFAPEVACMNRMVQRVVEEAVALYRPTGASVRGWSFFLKHLTVAPHQELRHFEAARNLRERITAQGDVNAFLRQHGRSIESLSGPSLEQRAC